MMNHLSILIHQQNGFARNWPKFLKDHGFSCNVMNAHDPATFASLLKTDIFLWNVNHEVKADHDFAIPLLQALKRAGVKTFPNVETCWHFDDKAAQAYLLEAIDAPIARSWIFTDRNLAEAFLMEASFPLVFKLKRGAGAINVRLVSSPHEAKLLIKRMFGRGFRTYPSVSGLQRGVKRGFSASPKKRDSLWIRGKRAANQYLTKLLNNEREQGYVLFQEFLADNTHDTRVTIIGDRAFVFNRFNRENDFRASGSGKIEYLSADQIPMDMVEVAFKISQSQNFQSMAYDFVRDPNTKEAKILEMCYTFKPDAVAACPGYMTPDGQWVEGHFRPEELILIDLLGLEV